jgi:hypothetical protein
MVQFMPKRVFTFRIQKVLKVTNGQTTQLGKTLVDMVNFIYRIFGSRSGTEDHTVVARVAINALGCEPGVESHDNIIYLSCSRTGDPLNIHRQHGDSSIPPAHNSSQ